MAFEVLFRSKRSRARVGRIKTKSGIIETPCFVPVATNATPKCVDIVTVARQTKIQLMFCNAYHLMIHPGDSAIDIHKCLFMNYSGPIITDSGGFQVFSLSERSNDAGSELKGGIKSKFDSSIVKISEDGVVFRSYRDGSLINLTPESTIEFQKQLNSDIIIPLDHLPPNSTSESKLKDLLDKTHLCGVGWQQRSLTKHLQQPQDQLMFSVIHGGTSQSLRQQSIDFLTALPFDGHAIGGSLGGNRQEMKQVVEFVMPRLPAHLPVHLLGMGDRESSKFAVEQGIDSMDSAYPTRLARHGNLLAFGDGLVDINDSKHKSNYNTAVVPDCQCHMCSNYSAAYVHHLYKQKEPTFGMLATIHNLFVFNQFMATTRQAILDGLI